MSDAARRDAEASADIAAACLLAVDPAGLGGVALRARSGPAREAWLGQLAALLPPSAPVRRVPLHVTDDRLLGGLDLAATLAAGRPVAARGLLAEADRGVVLLASAERLPAASAARLAAVLDGGVVTAERGDRPAPARIGVVALDEGMAEDERPPAALLDRLAFHLHLDDRAAAADGPARRETVAAARARLPAVRADPAALEALVRAAAALGIESLRAPLLALRAARAAAALGGRDAVAAADAALAGRLVLAPRAAAAPPPAPEEPAAPEADPPGDSGPDEETGASDRPLAEIVLEAARSAIPPGLLAALRGEAGGPAAAATRSSAGGRAGARGRPAGVRRGAPGRGARLDVVATLRAAAPWQPLRRADGGGGRGGRVEVRRDDFRVKRFKRRAGSTAIFVVDASGSAALRRLAEVKGAVELLADAYVRRDEVALIAFRGRGAELVLPPTRALARARRSLAGLPAGGGTPLAAGLDAARALAEAVRRKGRTPSLILLTDGGPNVARDGVGGRLRAEADGLAAAREIRAARLAALLVDTAPRPDAASGRLAAAMGADYLPLPRADAAALAGAVRAAAPAAGGPGARRDAL